MDLPTINDYSNFSHFNQKANNLFKISDYKEESTQSGFISRCSYKGSTYESETCPSKRASKCSLYIKIACKEERIDEFDNFKKKSIRLNDNSSNNTPPHDAYPPTEFYTQNPNNQNININKNPTQNASTTNSLSASIPQQQQQIISTSSNSVGQQQFQQIQQASTSAPPTEFYTQNPNNQNININKNPIQNALTTNSLSASIPQQKQQQQIISTSSNSVGQQQFQQTQQASTPPPLRNEYEIDFEELELGEIIGKGFFGEVKKGSWRKTDVVIKTIYREYYKDKSSSRIFQNEVLMLSKLRHPNVVQFLGAHTTGGKEINCIVTEWMSGGSLRQFLTHHFNILEKNPHLRLKIASDIAKGMCYLHGWDPKVLHRDLSSGNILLEHNIDLNNPSPRVYDIKSKISDFGLSRSKAEPGQPMSSVGCVCYMAPEVFKGECNSEKSDVYSYSMILWELLTSKEPQQDMDPQKMANLVAYESYRPPIPPATPQKWKDLLTQCWDADPDKRPTFNQIISDLNEMSEQGLPSTAPVIDPGVYI